MIFLCPFPVQGGVRDIHAHGRVCASLAGVVVQQGRGGGLVAVNKVCLDLIIH